MHPLIPQGIGIFAVALFLISYQQKKRRNIIIINSASRAAYVLQYILLGAFVGAALDVLGMISAILAGKKNTPFFKKYAKWWIIGIDAVIIVVGILLYKNIFSLFALAGILLQSTALWLNNERSIRIVSLIGSPFWLTYNLTSHAFGSAVGDALTICSIAIAMVKYKDFCKKPITTTEEGSV